MEQPAAQPQQPQPVTTAPVTVTVISSTTAASSSSNTTLFDEGFENFFNNESLSDRILNIIETEKVSLSSLVKNCLLGKQLFFIKSDALNFTVKEEFFPTLFFIETNKKLYQFNCIFNFIVFRLNVSQEEVHLVVEQKEKEMEN